VAEILKSDHSSRKERGGMNQLPSPRFIIKNKDVNELDDVPIYKILASNVEVREKKQLSSKQITCLKKDEVIEVKAFWHNTALLESPVVGWINLMSGKGQPLIKAVVRSTKSRKSTDFSADWQDGYDSLSTGSSLSSHATAWKSSSSISSQSRSLSPASRILRKKSSDIGIMLKRRDISRLVTVQGYYGMIIGQAYEDEVLHEILLDGQTETIFLTEDEFTLLVPDHKVLFRDQKLTRQKFIRSCSRHNRESTRIAMEYDRRKFRRHNHRVRFNMGDLTDGCDSFEPCYQPLEILKKMDAGEIVKILHELMKRELLDVANHTRMTESQLLKLKCDNGFQRGFMILTRTMPILF